MELYAMETTLLCPDHNMNGGRCTGTLVGKRRGRHDYYFVCAVCGTLAGRGQMVTDGQERHLCTAIAYAHGPSA
jgi:hypothetical protein